MSYRFIDYDNLKFKGCPFCNGIDLHFVWEEHHCKPDEVYIKCNSCGARGGKYFTTDQAVEKWNTRYSFLDAKDHGSFVMFAKDDELDIELGRYDYRPVL